MKMFGNIPTNRIEAFSDGVIAILITVMVFDLKIQGMPNSNSILAELWNIFPKWISYSLSFLMISIMWISHHQLFHQIKHSDRKLLWYNIHLLFWMSLIPFVTNLIGTHPMLWQASCCYGLVFFLCAWSFTLLRNYVVQTNLLHEGINKQAHLRIRNKNRIALLIYFVAALASMASVYLSFILFLVVPAMYIIPENIHHQTTHKS